MRPVLLLLLCGIVLLAQPTQVRIEGEIRVQHQPSPLGVFLDSTRQATETAQHIRELQIQQGYLDLARRQAEELRQQREASAQLESRVLADDMGYRRARNETQAAQEVRDAFLSARMAHDDFDALLPAMRIIAGSLRPQWSAITMTEYVECLYVITKNANFAAPVRDSLLASHQKKPPTP
jgi:hypothetical protein